jgi:mRNA m6A methyltransferase non-catalytic subunit
MRAQATACLAHVQEHCLMGIRGTVRRSNDGHIIHTNVDTDVIISEEPEYGSTEKPEELYVVVEHFAMGPFRHLARICRAHFARA